MVRSAAVSWSRLGWRAFRRARRSGRDASAFGGPFEHDGVCVEHPLTRRSPAAHPHQPKSRLHGPMSRLRAGHRPRRLLGCCHGTLRPEVLHGQRRDPCVGSIPTVSSKSLQSAAFLPNMTRTLMSSGACRRLDVLPIGIRRPQGFGRAFSGESSESRHNGPRRRVAIGQHAPGEIELYAGGFAVVVPTVSSFGRPFRRSAKHCSPSGYGIDTTSISDSRSSKSSALHVYTGRSFASPVAAMSRSSARRPLSRREGRGARFSCSNSRRVARSGRCRARTSLSRRLTPDLTRSFRWS